MILGKFHKWYDTVGEPWRFLILVAIAIPILSIIPILNFNLPRIVIPIVLALAGISFIFMITRVQVVFKFKHRSSFKFVNGMIIFVFALIAVSLFLAYFTHATTEKQLREAMDRKAHLETLIDGD